MRTLLAVVVAVLCILMTGIGTARADRLDLVQRRGALVVGVKADYVPFGMYDRQGRLIGIEADLAAELAQRLGVRLELVAVTSANRLQKLEQGSIDVVIATLGDTAQRRAIATLVEPGYFASGANVMLRPDAGRVDGWDDLTGRTLCATQGALFNAESAQRYLLELKVYGSNRDAKMALRDGRCVGWLYDDIAIRNQIGEPDWTTYRMSLPTAVPTPWAVALERSERGGRLERLIGDAVAEWHRSGWLIETFARWGIPEEGYLARMNALWNERRGDGGPLCQRLSDGDWPVECREESRITTADVTGLHQLVLRLRDHTGLYFSFLINPFEQRQLLVGIMASIALIVASIAGSLLLGMLGAVLLTTRHRPIVAVTSGFAALCRMTPPLLQLYLVFFGLGQLLAARAGIRLDAFAVAVLCFSLYAGAANATVLAEARAAVHGGWRAVLRSAWTPVMSSSVNIAKATGMASAIAVPELVYASTSIVGESGNPSVLINLLLLLYFLMVLAVVQGFEIAGRRWLAR